jgi:hypothetical protein
MKLDIQSLDPGGEGQPIMRRLLAVGFKLSNVRIILFQPLKLAISRVIIQPIHVEIGDSQ